ncbi:MAG: ABC transporter substrate-binding protein [Elusimicrobiota bacterium]
MFKKYFLLSLFFILFPFLIAYSQTFPKRIISLGPTITENLYLLEIGDRIIANTIYCLNPEDAKYKEKIGTITEQNIEKIVSLKPDIVFATSLTNPKTIAKLQNLKINYACRLEEQCGTSSGIKVVQFSYAKSFDEICDQFLTLGRIVDREKTAKKIVTQAKKEVEKIRNKTKKLSRPKVFVQIGADPIFTATKESFINEFVLFAGGTNIASDAKSGIYSREKVVEQNPDIIILVTMGVTCEKERKNWEKFKTISAVKENKIYIVDSYKVCSPTPTSFVKTLNEIAEILCSKTKP